MKTVNYFWYGLTSFVQGFVPFFSLLTSLAAAFALVVIFPFMTVTLIAFGAALLVGTGFAIKQTITARKKQQEMNELVNKLTDELHKKSNLKKQHQHNQELREHLISSIHLSAHRNLLIAKALECTIFLNNKIFDMHHDEREKFIASPDCRKLNAILPKLQHNDLTDGELENQVTQLEELTISMMNKEEARNFSDNQALKASQHQTTVTTKPVKDHPTASALSKPKVGIWPSIGVGIKTSLLTFGFGCSIAAITACLVIGLSPIMIVATMPAAAIAVSLGIMVGAIALGAIAGTIYHKKIAPHQVQMTEATTRLPLVVQKNKDLVKKLEIETQLVEKEQNDLHATEVDNQFLFGKVQKNAEALHKAIDRTYQQETKIDVKTAMDLANHKQVKSHLQKPRLEKLSKENTSPMNDFAALSPEQQKFIMQQWQERAPELPGVKRQRNNMKDGG